MKTQIIFYTILFILNIKFVSAQITPIETTNDGDYTVYTTSQYSTHLQTIENQSPQLKLRIFEHSTKARYASGSGFNEKFFKETLSATNHNILVNNRGIQSRFSVSYIINENGTVSSCALNFPTNIVTLSSNEIETILTTAMEHKFTYVKKPQDIDSFFYNVKCDFIL